MNCEQINGIALIILGISVILLGLAFVNHLMNCGC